MSQIEVSPTQINLHRRSRFKKNALLKNLLDLYFFSDSNVMTVTDVEDNVNPSDPEPMWEKREYKCFKF